ncbi:family 78 glycoside hydrolase catalytic domain [Pseudocnuella soli]|uniref:family 78 glycoside hydrolase catalytic domain n=1 Tax=Pseudocnuella soli TaxID=2502779 RepID=UPI00104EF98E|nr:family 78 glycoside hydrolase catalytic domain [Pseudocnuella soli]
MKKIILLHLFAAMVFGAAAQLKVHHLLTENKPNPLGVDAAQPRFSWQLDAGNRRNVLQTAYELVVQTDDGQPVWRTGKVATPQSVLVPFKGPALASGKRYNWQVRVWDNAGNASDWSEPSFWQMGLLKPSDWKAQWIEPGFAEDATRPSPLLRKEFSIAKKLKRATAYITAHGLYEAYLNGSRIGDAYFTPGWTSYNKRLQYQAYDVTGQLQQGANAIGAALASGWYRGNLAWGGNRDIYGRDIALLMQLQLEFEDGTTEQIVTDGSWKSSTGAIRSSEIYHGEKVDARLDQPGWNKPGFNDASWTGVKTAAHAKELLVATYNEPIRKKETFAPVKIFTTPKGEQVIDFGQNLVGWAEVKVRGASGQQIILSHAEVLDKAGNFYITNLRAANSRDTFILKGGGEEVLAPTFTWHGFRYLKVEGYPSTLNKADFEAVALYSDMPVAGKFTSSNELINQLQHNIEWGQRGNFLDVPTDCPQRDERLGWTGDAQVFSRTAMFNMNVHSFFTKWMQDVSADQIDGAVPFVVPNVLGAGSVASAGWADAATIIPWNMYLAYGDTGILQQQYGSMKAWVEHMRRKSKNDLWNTGFHFGDWLFYRPDDDNDGRAAVTDKYLVAQCFYAHSTQLLVNAAKVLGKKADVLQYSALLQKIKDAFRKEYMTPSGRLVSGTQTAYVLALQFDMLPEALRKGAAERLAENVKSYGTHLTTGFLGTPYLCEVLSKNGQADVAFALLLREQYPSWLFPVKMGATTIWERWDGQKPDSSFQTPGMNSFNHYAYGAIGEWMYRTVAGLDTEEDGPGYKHIRVKPLPGGNFNHVAVTLQTYYGPVTSGWKREGASFNMEVVIPANTQASVFIPAPSVNAVREGDMALSQNGAIKVIGYHNGYVQVKIGSGSYQFTTTGSGAATTSAKR